MNFNNPDNTTIDDVTIKAFLEAIVEGVVIANEKGKIIFINKKFAELTGYSKEEATGENINIFISSSLHENHNNHIRKFFSNPNNRPMGSGMSLTAKRKDNTEFPVEISLSFINSKQGKLALAFINDITTRKKAEDDLKKRNQELDAYAHTVAHDLNSSLIGIIGYSDLLLTSEDDIPYDKREKYLQTINRSGNKMTEVVKEMLAFAGMKKEDIEVTSVNMHEVANSAIQRLNYQIEKKNARIIISQNLPECMGYAAWIEEVWYNFLSNALKYGGNPPVIEISGEIQNDGYVKYSVTDNGPGISEELKNVIFEEKNHTKDHLKKGYGLGLSIVKRIIEKLDGRLSVESGSFFGSTFSFLLKS